MIPQITVQLYSVRDLAKQDYRPSTGKVADEVQAILKERNPAKQLAALRASAHPQAQFLWSIFRDLFHYVAVHLGEIAHSARDVDFAIRWGFGWSRGPFMSSSPMFSIVMMSSEMTSA